MCHFLIYARDIYFTFHVRVGDIGVFSKLSLRGKFIILKMVVTTVSLLQKSESDIKLCMIDRVLASSEIIKDYLSALICTQWLIYGSDFDPT